MKRLRHLLMLILVTVIAVSLVLLSNVTAPNPTGRRYSSAMPPESDGVEAENILARDLRLIRNSASSPRQCICEQRASSGRLPQGCGVCFVFLNTLSDASSRVPDFVSAGYLADSKNVQRLSLTGQIADFTAAARESNRSLWLFVRVDSEVDPRVETAVQSTGGAVVRYFVVPGWNDPVDEAARNALLIAGALLVLLFAQEAAFWDRFSGKPPVVIVLPPKSPRPPATPPGPMGKAAKSAETLTDFQNRARDRARRRIDEADRREDEDDSD